MPAEAAKAVTGIIGINMTYDGYIAAAAPGAVVVLDRDLNVKSYITFSGEAVDNSIAIDERNGIYVVTSRRMLNVVWNGQKLSTDEKDGGWESGYEWIPVVTPNLSGVRGQFVRRSLRPRPRAPGAQSRRARPPP